jgi:hypothetical protein
MLIFGEDWKLHSRDLIMTLLQFDTKYYYAVGTEETMRKFWFKTPPKSGPDVPYTFGLIGIIILSQLLCVYASSLSEYRFTNSSCDL